MNILYTCIHHKHYFRETLLVLVLLSPIADVYSKIISLNQMSCELFVVSTPANDRVPCLDQLPNFPA